MDREKLQAQLHDSKLFILFELAVLAAIFIADERGLIVFTKTLYILAFASAALWIRRARWRDLGFRVPPNWRRMILVGIAAGVAMSALELLVTQPLLVRLTGQWPDLSVFEDLTGNLKLLALLILLAWTVAAVGEELVYRAWLLNRLNDLFGKRQFSTLAALLAMTVIFAFAHGYQGITGVAENAIAAVLLGLLYLSTNRNLIAPMIAHGIVDTIDFTLIYLGRYPGM